MGDCTVYGSGCLTYDDWKDMQHGVDGDPATADVLIVGDSITNGGRTYLAEALQPAGLTLCADYWSSRPTTPPGGAMDRLLSYSRLYQPNPFKVVVGASGTNDIMVDPSLMPASLARVVNADLDSELLWVSIYAGRSATLTADLRNTGWVNDGICRSGIEVIDWFEDMAEKPSRVSLYLRDGVHPKLPTVDGGAGYRHWAAVLAPQIIAAAARFDARVQAAQALAAAKA